MSERPLVIEAPEPAAEAAQAAAPAPPEPTPQGTATPKTRNKKQKTEFDILGDIQDAFEALPSNAARHRVWEYLTSWMGETYPASPPLISYSNQLPPLTQEEVQKLLGQTS